MSDRPTPETDAAANESIVKVYETSKRLERQRDELMEAMEELIPHRPHQDWEGLTLAESRAWDFAEDAIASVKEGKP